MIYIVTTNFTSGKNFYHEGQELKVQESKKEAFLLERASEIKMGLIVAKKPCKASQKPK